MTQDQSNRAAESSGRAYRLFLSFYPRAFRRAYGEAMIQLFRDQCRDACLEGGRWGLMKAWWRGLFDLGRSACAEQMSNLNQELNMTSTSWFNRTRRLAALTVFIIVCGLSFTATWLLPRHFQSTARITVKKDAPDTPDLSMPAGTFFDPYFVQTEFERLRSKAVLYPVIEGLKLNERWARQLGQTTPLTPQETYLLLQKRLDVHHYRNTSIIEIRVFSEDRNEAAEIANATANAYRRMRLESLEVSSSRGLDVLRRELAEQEAKIKDTQSVVNQLRAQGNIPEGLAEGQNVDGADRVRRLEAQAMEAELVSSQMESLCQRLQALDPLELRQVLPTAQPDVLLTELLTRYNQMEVELLALKKDRTDGHPEVQRAQVILTKLDDQIEQRIQGILAGLQLKARNLEQEKDLRQKAWKNQEHQSATLASFYESYFAAKRELESQKQLHRTIALRLQQEKMQSELPRTASVEIVDRAEPGLRPVRPNRPLNIVVGILLGFISSGVLLLLMLFKSLLTRPDPVSA
jgi:polysaccharide biosynthesis transport protein